MLQILEFLENFNLKVEQYMCQVQILFPLPYFGFEQNIEYSLIFMHIFEIDFIILLYFLDHEHDIHMPNYSHYLIIELN
jgi:hypothetical protein